MWKIYFIFMTIWWQTLKKKKILKLIFITVLRFRKLLYTEKVKCISLNNKSYVTRHAFIDINPVELHCYAFMVSSDDLMVVEIFLTIIW